MHEINRGVDNKFATSNSIMQEDDKVRYEREIVQVGGQAQDEAFERAQVPVVIEEEPDDFPTEEILKMDSARYQSYIRTIAAQSPPLSVAPTRKNTEANGYPADFAAFKRNKEPTTMDVRFGHGIANTMHHGTQLYLQLVMKYEPLYKAEDATYKTRREIAERVIRGIRSKGGRFLMFDTNTNQWCLVSSLSLYRKVHHCLTHWPVRRSRKRIVKNLKA